MKDFRIDINSDFPDRGLLLLFGGFFLLQTLDAVKHHIE